MTKGYLRARNKPTKLARAIDLQRRVARGPLISVSGLMIEGQISRENAVKLHAYLTGQFRIWAESWVNDDLIDLVPELRQKAKDEKEDAARKVA